MLRKTAVLIVATVAAATSFSANAVPITLTFDNAFNGPVYTEAGADISANAGSANVNVTGGGALGFNCCAAPINIDWSFTTGGLFDLLSINVIHVDAPDPVTFTGWLNGVQIATQTFTGNAGLFNFAGFTGLDEVTITANMGSFADPSFDNLTFESVPVPATLALLLAGFGGLAMARRRSV
jgi:hypothetical protein